jgi:hypothetical protein
MLCTYDVSFPRPTRLSVALTLVLAPLLAHADIYRWTTAR